MAARTDYTDAEFMIEVVPKLDSVDPRTMFGECLALIMND